MSENTHPFAKHLIDLPDVRLLQRSDLESQEPGMPVAVTILTVVVPPPTFAVAMFDLNVSLHEGQLRLTWPNNADEALRSTKLVVGKVKPDGSIFDYVIGLGYCNCSGDCGPLWNPLGLTFVWTPEFPNLVPKLSRRWQAAMHFERSSYCFHGITLLSKLGFIPA